MKKTLKKISGAAAKKLRRSAGETLAETLIAVLIAALAVTMLAFMLTTSADLVRQSSKSFSDYYDKNNALTARSGSGDATGAAHLRTSGGAEVQLFLPDPGEAYGGADVDCYVNSEAPAGTPVISYKYDP